MEAEPRILVVGSINMDLVVRAKYMPAPGETVGGEQFVTSPGGKGANQAVAAARLGAKVTMVGRVGDDAFGERMLAVLRAEGVNCDRVMKTQGAHTGVAMIVVDSLGENAIVVAGGANALVTPDDVIALDDLFARADAVLLQLELPLPTVRAAIDLARRHGCRVILDPAPACRNLCDHVCSVDVIAPNVTEAEIITGRKTGEEHADRNVASYLIERGAKAVVLKLGGRGSLVVCADGQMARAPAYKVSLVDTTAAGDAFNAALACAMLRGADLPAAAKFANAAGALTCTKLGAQSALPTLAEVRALMARQIPD